MKKILTLSIFLVSVLAIEAGANTEFPREVSCTDRAGHRLTLRSNNGFFSQAEGGKYKVDLLLERGNGREVYSNPVTNDEASRVRGTDEGNKRYSFAPDIQVELEFATRNGLATGVQTFKVIGNGLNFIHSPQMSDGSCELRFLKTVRSSRVEQPLLR